MKPLEIKFNPGDDEFAYLDRLLPKLLKPGMRIVGEFGDEVYNHRVTKVNRGLSSVKLRRGGRPTVTVELYQLSDAIAYGTLAVFPVSQRRKSAPKRRRRR